MRKKELTWLEVMEHMKTNGMVQKKAAETLGISVRQVKAGLVHLTIVHLVSHLMSNPLLLPSSVQANWW